MKVLFDFFSDFEGQNEAGIQFLRVGKTGAPQAFLVWVGYFDTIMGALFDLYVKKRGVGYFPLLEMWNECKGFSSVEGGRSILQDLPTIIDALKKLSSEVTADPKKLYGGIEINSVGELDCLIVYLQEADDANLTVSVEDW